MTTACSPIDKLKRQADEIAALLKAIEAGTPHINTPFAAKIAAARERENVKFAIAMDDKAVIVDMRWDFIHLTKESSIAAHILDLMRRSPQ